MDLDPCSPSPSVPAFDAPAAHCSANIVTEVDVRHFLLKNGIQAEYDFVLDRFNDIFHPEKITVSLIGSSDDGADGEERLLFLVRCNMDRKMFRSNCDHFYQPLRHEKNAIYTRMSILSDL